MNAQNLLIPGLAAIAVAMLIYAIWQLMHWYKLNAAETLQSEVQGRTRKTREQEIEALKEVAEIQRRIHRYPIQHLSQAEFEAIPCGADIDLKSCPLGTWFKCSPSKHAPDVVVIGQVVEGMQLFADQWGAGMSPPDRGINRYRVEIITPAAA